MRTWDKDKNKMNKDYNFADPNWESYDFGHWTIPNEGETISDFTKTFQDKATPNTENDMLESSLNKHSKVYDKQCGCECKCECGKSKHTVEIREVIIFS